MFESGFRVWDAPPQVAIEKLNLDSDSNCSLGVLGWC